MPDQEELTPLERRLQAALEAEELAKAQAAGRGADKVAASQLRAQREALAAELLQQRATAGHDVSDPEVLAQVEQQAWDEVNRRRWGDKPRQRRMATHSWYWARKEDQPLPPPVWPERHPLAPDPPLRLASGWDPAAWYRARCRRRGWEGRRPRPGEGWPQCCNCGLRYQLRHLRAEDRELGQCFRCLSRARGWMPPLDPGRVPARTDGPHGIRVYGHYGSIRPLRPSLTLALAEETARRAQRQ